MKKNAVIKDFFRTVRGSRNRFLSILFIVALGVSFYTGIKSAKPDMQLSVDALYDRANMMDIRVMGTLGMTQEDLNALKEIEGVTDVRGGYTAYALNEQNGRQSVVSVLSLTDGMNEMTIKEGRLPIADNECFLDDGWMGEAGFQIGDTIVLKSGKAEDDLLDTLTTDTFTIVGAGSYPWYLNFDRGTANVGSGDVSFFICVPPESFDLDVYTVAYLTTDGADEMLCYGDEYKAYVEKITDRIEEISDVRCEIRYQQVQDEGMEKIADARQDIADGEQELADARAELQDAEKKLEDAAQELVDGEQGIADGEQEIADAKSELRAQQKKLDEGWEELNQAKAELEDAGQELSDAWGEMQSGSAQLSNNRSRLDAQNKQFEAYAAQVEPLRDQVEYEKAKIAYDQLKDAQSAGYPLGEQEQSALAFYDAVLPALYQAAALGTSLPDAVEGMLQPTRDQIADGYAKLDAADRELSSGRTQLNQARSEYDDAMRTIAENEQQLLDGQEEIDRAWRELRDAQKDLEEARQELEDGKKEYEDAKLELLDAQNEFEEKSADAEQDIAKAKEEVADAEQGLLDLEKPEWYVLDRESIQSYVEFGMDADRIGALGLVFPVIFFLVAALVALTTMTRMVEEGRLQAGTMKALGYSKFAIAGKYIGYALFATLVGGVIGIPIGAKLFPYVIMNAYGMLYINLDVMLMPIQWDLSVAALCVSLVCTVGATIAACYAQLMATPAQLMRPAAPPEGKRVILEYIPALWKRMSFTQKATFRNLFRYKKRFLMTIFGIGACMGLLLVGFGVRDSISEIVNKQYSAVWTYDVSVNVDSEESDVLAEVEAAIAELDEVQAQLTIEVSTIDARANGVTKSVNLFVPESAEDLPKIVRLQTRRGKKPLQLSDEGVIINEKAARLLSLEIGDSIELMIDETQSVQAKVTGITENYLNNYVYMTADLYETLYGEAPEFSAIFLESDVGAEGEHALGEKLLAIEHVAGVSFVSTLQEQVGNMMRSLDLVVWVLVAAAGLLAFIVLYNLNNISIIERRRELATLKVLGFHDQEVAAYIYRENVWLTGIGILLGALLGMVLHKFIIRTCEIDMLMFGQDIQFMSYVYSAAMTCVFAVIVNFSMYFGLKKIDMVESMKSVE